MLAADDNLSIYEQVFETDHKRPFSDTEPLLIDAMDTTRFLTFESLRTNVRALATALGGPDYQIKQGDVVAICSPSDIEYAVAMHGVMAAGAGACLIPPMLTSNEIAAIFQVAEPKLVVAHPASVDTLHAALKEYGTDLPMLLMNCKDHDSSSKYQSIMDVCSKHDPQQALPRVSPDTNAYFVCTSGSTGARKLATISHRVGVLRIRALVGAMARTANARARTLATSQFGFAFGSAIPLQASVQCGIRMYVVETTDFELILSKVQEFRCTSISLVSTNVIQAAYHPEIVQKYDVSSLQVGTTAGQVVRREHKLKAKENLGLALILTFYGSTESFTPLAFVPQHNLPETSGKAPDMEGWAVKLVDQAGQEVRKGELGELLAKNPLLANGYYKRPDETAEAFDRDGFFHTQDMFIVQENDEFLFMGRKNEMIITPESKLLPPKTIEDICMSHSAIRECIVVGAQSDKLGYQLPRAYIVLKDAAAVSDKESFIKEFIGHVNERVPEPAMKLDGGARILDQFPRLSTGKTDMRQLRAAAKQELEEGA